MITSPWCYIKLVKGGLELIKTISVLLCSSFIVTLLNALHTKTSKALHEAL